MGNYCSDSYCGLYCGACDVQVADKRSKISGELPIWEDLPERFRKNLPSGKTDKIHCLGCKSDDVFIGCASCKIRKCAKEKMKVEFCFECRKFPCFTYKIQRIVLKLMFEKKLPHLKTIPYNQHMIHRDGVDEWLKDQKEKWQCSKCSTEFSWYQATCLECGADLHSNKDDSINFNGKFYEKRKMK